jgi:hypothetical protein
MRRPESESSSEVPEQKWSLPTGGGSASPKSRLCLVLPSSRPPCEISEALGTSCQHDSSPKRSAASASRRHGSFCKKAAARQPKMTSPEDLRPPTPGIGPAWRHAPPRPAEVTRSGRSPRRTTAFAQRGSAEGAVHSAGPHPTRLVALLLAGTRTGTFTGERAGVLTTLPHDAKHAGHEPDLSHAAA